MVKDAQSLSRKQIKMTLNYHLGKNIKVNDDNLWKGIWRLSISIYRCIFP